MHPEKSASLPSATVLLVDDNEAVRVLVNRYLRRVGFTGEVIEAQEPQEALALMQQRKVDGVVTDHFFHGKAMGLGLVREIRARHPAIPVVVFSSADQLGGAAVLAGATSFVSTKHWDELALRVRELVAVPA